MEKDGQFWEKWISKMRKNERMHQNASSATAISVVNIRTMFPDSSCLFRQDERFIVPCIGLRFVEIMSRLADEQTEPLCNGDVRGMEIVAQVSSV